MKHFYNETLAASWMAQNHKMKFVSARGQKLYFDGGTDFRTEKDSGLYACEKYFVSPDSIHLLIPQRGDLVLASYYHKTNYVYRLVTNVFKDGFEVGGFSRYGYGEAIDGREIHKIIQRNKVAFIIPECEEA